VMITNNTEEVVSKFAQEFEKLWTEFAPWTSTLLDSFTRATKRVWQDFMSEFEWEVT
jgi:oligoendopeptidase F